MSAATQWSALLPLLLGGQPQGINKPAMATPRTLTTKVDLVDLPREMSLTSFLSPAGGHTIFEEVHLTLMNKDKQLDSSHLILLALNEECRDIGRGAFYHLSLRSGETEGHPCDLVYLPDNWTNHDTTSWDESTWVERLEMCKIEGRIEANEEVLPICVRMLQFYTGFNDDCNSLRSTYFTCSSSPTLSGKDSITSTHLKDTITSAPSSQLDPAIKPNSYRYSRPMEDVSTIIIVYTSHHSTPSVCSTAAFEHDSLCTRGATPGDFSETFDYGERMTHGSLMSSRGAGTQSAQEQIAKMAAERVLASGMSSNRELVEHIWNIYHDDFNQKDNLEKDWLGRMVFSWQEVKSIIDGGGLGLEDLPYGWPMSE